MVYLSRDCELRQTLTLAQAVKKVRNGAPKPVCVIVFGANGSNNKDAINEINTAWGLYTVIPSFDGEALGKSLRINSLAVVKMSPEESVDHGKLLAMIDLARRFGAKTVMGVYVSSFVTTPINMVGASREAIEVNERARILAKSPPTMEGLDYMIEL